ncbi:hypothetical protein [Novosphingobium sp. KACC 22771]|uniref:hypothetical protein n=1 Tax=Novosphingobium sp. KACC 22771 TaxID=3025670 RepID=UPI002365AE7E|nr:hypothetical protein [Novosphingobium sp. KACC 22771]WDF72265.1 hypothetical protein PQ467_15970 [Novosphingobium sp. KACC 22771]
MRDDMFKVIVERPRRGASHAVSPKLKRIPDADTKQIGLKRHARIGVRNTKMLNENLAPLLRYLRRQRGRRWDAVFSEICASIDTGSTVKMHVRQHIEDFVLTRISIGRDGEWMFEGNVLARRGPMFYRREMFVDPRDGILKDMSALEKLLATHGKGGAQ